MNTVYSFTQKYIIKVLCKEMLSSTSYTRLTTDELEEALLLKVQELYDAGYILREDKADTDEMVKEIIKQLNKIK